MKCISCELDINPQWKHAIDMNVCPFCGKHIMEEHLKNLLSGLRTTMESLQNYSAQLDDFLLSNYNYIKTDSPDLKDYLPKEVIKELRKEIDDAEFQEKKRSVMKIKTRDEDGNIIEQDVTVEKIGSDNRTQTFHDRANNMLKQEKAVDGEPKSVAERTKDLRKLKAQIEAEAAGATSTEEGNMVPMTEVNADPEAVAALRAELENSDIVASGLADTPSGDDDEIPSVVLSMANRANRTTGGNKERDLETLREMESKVLKAQKRLESGKGGFSRT